MALSVLHVIPALAERYGGPSAATPGMCRALRGAGIDARVAATDADGPGRLPVETGRFIEYEGVPTIFFPRERSESLKWSGSLGRWLRAHVRDFDIVHAHAVFSHSTIAAGRACRAAGVPYVIRPLGTLDPWSLGRHRRRKQVLLGLGLRSVLTDASAMHYTTDEEQRLAETSMPGLPPGAVVPLGLDESWFGPSPAADRPNRVVVLARLDRKKGIETAIEAFHACATDVPDWRLDIAGTGDEAYERELKRLAAAGPAGDRIAFLGWLRGDARRELLLSSRVFLMPSHQENFGISAVEAMACGTPVIVAPGVNLAATVVHHGAGWQAGPDAGSFTEALRSALNDGAGLAARGEKARQLAGGYRWPAVARQLQELYARLASREPAGRLTQDSGTAG